MHTRTRLKILLGIFVFTGLTASLLVNTNLTGSVSYTIAQIERCETMDLTKDGVVSVADSTTIRSFQAL